MGVEIPYLAELLRLFGRACWGWKFLAWLSLCGYPRAVLYWHFLVDKYCGEKRSDKKKP